jgi:SCP-2 sterol transfer family
VAGDDDATAAQWLRLAAEVGAGLPARPGVTGTVALVVTGTEAGEVTSTLVWEDGRLVAATPGAPADPALTLTLPAADGRAVLAGELEPSVAFMRGRLKTAGDNGLVLGVLGATQGAPLRAWLAGVAKVA